MVKEQDFTKSKAFKIIAINILIISIISFAYIIGINAGKILICKNNDALLLNDSCVISPKEVFICTINGVPYTLTDDFSIVQEINPYYNATFNLTK